MHIFAIVSLTPAFAGAYHPAALGRSGSGPAMTLRSARGLVVLAIVFASIGAGFWLHALWTTHRTPPAATPQTLSTTDGLQAAFVTVAERVRPAVVHIGTVQVARTRRPPASPGPFADDPLFKEFFDQFFGPRTPGNRGEFHQPGLGSGVIVDRRGYVLTNFHVIKGADGVLVRLSSKREYRGRIVGTDTKTDLAVVRFEPEAEVTVATLGNSDALRVGEWAVAIGNPFGLDQTVTVGVVSATGRADVGIASYENFIQTDASINPGNSGGPLVNLRGEVIGINTAIVATGQGIGFAIPANMAKRIVNQLIDRGRVTRGWLGVAVQPLTVELAQAVGVKETTGAVVSRVYPSSPAAAAELKQNDVIVTFDGVTVEDYNHLHRLAAEAEVGRTVKLGIVRDKQPRTVDLKITEAPDAPAAGR
ncbi:MAG: peptidase [Candidatus Rokuibacteriota bacterium]|nr:MAG: peptidase [Candidatus Rokubacteria bacterium]